MKRLSNRSRTAAVAFLVAVAVAGCGGGGGGGGNTPTPPPPPARMISWSGDGTPGAQTVYLEIRDLSNPDEFILQIRVSDVDDLYGVALDVLFPGGQLDFLEAQTDEGEFLPFQGAFETELQITESEAGRIVIGYTRLGEVRGRSGNGLLLQLPFRTTANGSSGFDIERQLAVDRDGQPVSTTWLGGTVEVQR